MGTVVTGCPAGYNYNSVSKNCVSCTGNSVWSVLKNTCVICPTNTTFNATSGLCKGSVTTNTTVVMTQSTCTQLNKYWDGQNCL